MNPGGEDFYKPSGGTAVADAPAPQPTAAGAGLPAGQAGKPPPDNFSWTASEYVEHNRSSGWYLMLALGTVALAVVVYFLTKEYFATGIIVVVGIIAGLYSRQKPKQVTYELSNSGLRIGEKMYDYGLFKSFSLVKDAAITSVQLTPLKKLMPPVSAFYSAADEEKITDIIGQHLPYEDAKPDRISDLSRRLKF